MKKTRRFAAIAAAAMMTAALAVPMMGMHAVAAEHSITIRTTDDANHSYEAYQIFKGDYANGVLSNIEWGNGVNDAKLLPALKADDVLGGYFENCETAADVADVLGSAKTGDAGAEVVVFADDEAATKKFAAIVGECLSNTTSGMNALSDGYYLVKDSTKPTMAEDGTNSGAYTRYLLKVTDSATITIDAKHSAPTVVKKVQENSDVDDYKGNGEKEDNWNDIADYNIGDAVPFRLYGTMPDTIDDYSGYYYEFTDTLGTEFNAPAVSAVTVKIDGKEIAQGGNLRVTVGTDNKISIAFEDIKQAATVTKNSIVTVSYEAVLNNTADLGLDGQVNGVKLSYSNNPNLYYKPNTNDETPDKPGDDDKGETVEDGVIVFTYGIDINKVDEDGETKLPDAVFAVKTSDGKYINVNDDTGAVTVVDTEDAATKWTSVADENIVIKGLDAGKYFITEITAPSGYNKMANDIEVEVIPDYAADRQSWLYAADKSTAGDALNALQITNADENSVTVESGKGTFTIVNKKGSSLPATGGIGTALFYAVGGVLVVGAGVTLITKKRVGKDAE